MNEHSAPSEPSNSKRSAIILISILLSIGLFFVGYKWLTQWRYMVSTNDAYVQADIANIAPKVSGYIEKIYVNANSPVKKEDILFHLDDKAYKIALAQTEVTLETQKKTLKRMDEQIASKEISLEQVRAQKDAALSVKKNAELTLKRTKELKNSHYVSQSQFDSAKSVLEQANAKLASAESQIKGVESEIKILQAQKEEAKSNTLSLELARDKAQHDLSLTILTAPFDGIVSNISAKQGDFVSNGQRLAAIVPINKLYIEANYKETQLENIHPGQKAYITIDAMKNEVFTGKVVSISPATGALFSLLPPQNATGNFTKVIQRIPVRIELPKEALNLGRIRAGMSAVVQIDTRTTENK